MQYRNFKRLGWKVSEIGYGTWGIGGGEHGWQGSSDEEAMTSLSTAVELGVNFFDTAWIYGRGHSENILSRLKSKHPEKKLYIGTKVPPKDMCWPARKEALLEEVFPNDHIESYTKKSLENLNVEKIDLLQFHVWQDNWHKDDQWKNAIRKLKEENLIEGVGISVNTWEPNNVIETLKTGLIDCVQVIYNIFEQRPEDELLPYCLENDIAVIARVPFDEGSLTGNISIDTVFDEKDWRASYFVPENLQQCIPRVDSLREIASNGFTLPEIALKFILQNPAITTVIPGMRKLQHVKANLALSGSPLFSDEKYREIKKHRWDRTPTSWSQ